MKSKWIQVSGVGKVNLDYAQCIRLNRGRKDEKSRVAIEMADGKTIYRGELYESDAEELEYIEYSGKVIPANPGFFVVWYWFDKTNGSEGHNKYEVICWEMAADGFHKAISLFGHSGENNSAILCPDGTVVEPGNQIFKDIEEWLKDKREEQAKSSKKTA